MTTMTAVGDVLAGGVLIAVGAGMMRRAAAGLAASRRATKSSSCAGHTRTKR